MNNCDIVRKWFIEAYYHELSEDNRRIFDDHLRNCPECAAEFSNIKSTLKHMKNYSRPQPGTEFWDSYWDNLYSRLETGQTEPSYISKKHVKWFPSFIWKPPRTIRTAIGAAAVLLIGILIGKTFFGGHDIPPVQTYISSTPPVQIDLTRARAEHYLERAKLVLLGIVNLDPQTELQFKPSFARQKQISRELINQSDELKIELRSTEQLRLLDLISDLEVILLQIANLEDDYDLEKVELIQTSAERKAILFKINIDEMRSNGMKDRYITQNDRRI